MIICCHCSSQMIAEDNEFISGHGWTIRRRCLKCGREKFKEVENEKNYSENYSTDHDDKDVSPMQLGESLKKKEVRRMVTESDCRKYGITLEQYKANKRTRTESLERVVERMKHETGIPVTEKAKPETKAHEPKKPEAKAWPPDAEDAKKATKAKDEKKYSSYDILDVVGKCMGVFAPPPDKLVSDQFLLGPIFLNNDLLDKLKAKAKADYRTLELEAAYLIDKGLQE